MKPNQKIDTFFIYFLKRSWGAMFVVVVIVTIFLKFHPPSFSDSIEAPHVCEWLERMFAYITFFVAITLWWGQKRAEWIDYLPNRLTVSFLFEGREVMRCEKAHLSNESDIRALSQTIGAQMVHKVRLNKNDQENKVEQLNFIPAKVEIDPYELKKNERFLHYQARIYLTELPNAIKEKLAKKLNDKAEDEVLVWGPDFDKDPAVERIQS